MKTTFNLFLILLLVGAFIYADDWPICNSQNSEGVLGTSFFMDCTSDGKMQSEAFMSALIEYHTIAKTTHENQRELNLKEINARKKMQIEEIRKLKVDKLNVPEAIFSFLHVYKERELPNLLEIYPNEKDWLRFIQKGMSSSFELGERRLFNKILRNIVGNNPPKKLKNQILLALKPKYKSLELGAYRQPEIDETLDYLPLAAQLGDNEALAKSMWLIKEYMKKKTDKQLLRKAAEALNRYTPRKKDSFHNKIHEEGLAQIQKLREQGDI